jgi:hypothetical protein
MPFQIKTPQVIETWLKQSERLILNCFIENKNFKSPDGYTQPYYFREYTSVPLFWMKVIKPMAADIISNFEENRKLIVEVCTEYEQEIERLKQKVKELEHSK